MLDGPLKVVTPDSGAIDCFVTVWLSLGLF